MPKIFISYAREDARHLADRLKRDLDAVGYEAWLDTAEITGGVDWERGIENAIESSEIVLALLSHGAYTSDICRSEQSRAIRKGKRLIPLLVHPDAERPIILETINYLDFSDETRYDGMFRDLISDITAGEAFKVPETRATQTVHAAFNAPHTPTTRPYTADEKRDARAFRRYIKDLREEAWLGARYWWPYFLFYYTDVQAVADILQTGALYSRAKQAALSKGGGPQRKPKLDKWDNYARLYFRPRTPDLFACEGLRPLERQRAGAYVPVPVYLLFDMEAVLCQMETRFSDGALELTDKTFKSAQSFRELPFELIYHDGWFSREEREEVMRCRKAQVLAPDKLGLESLQFIWCRSQAEYETLRSLLPPHIWKTWRAKITARTDFNLFNRKWPYVEEAALTANDVRLRFNPAESKPDAGPFMAKAEIRTQDGARLWNDDTLVIDGDLLLDLGGLRGASSYTVKFWLNGDLAYAGEWSGDGVLL